MLAGGDILKLAAYAGLAGALGIGVWALAIVTDERAMDEVFGDWPHVPDEGLKAGGSGGGGGGFDATDLQGSHKEAIARSHGEGL